MARYAGHPLNLGQPFSRHPLPHGDSALTDPQFKRDLTDHPAVGADESHARIDDLSHAPDITPPDADSSTNIQQPDVKLGNPEVVDQGTRIRLARQRAKLTQVQLARQLRVRQSAVSQWENGTVSPELETRVRLAAVLRMPLSDVLPEISGANVPEDLWRDPQVMRVAVNFYELPPDIKASIELMILDHAERLRARRR